ncbi:SDR family NAD(P)-dependent oxidoreductase, partial [Parasutterella excrementihominis]
MKTLTIITGASKGLGFELTRQSLKAGDTVVTMERRPSKALVEEADKIGCNFIQFTADLLDRKGAVELLMWLLSDKEYAEHDRLILINNAGVLGPVGPIENASPQVAVDCIRVNFEIPVLL